MPGSNECERSNRKKDILFDTSDVRSPYGEATNSGIAGYMAPGFIV